MEIAFYVKENRQSPPLLVIQKLSAKDKARVLACLRNVEELGFNCQRVNFRQIRGKLWEIKIRITTGGFRLFYVCVDRSKLTILHAYHKKTQKAPIKEIELAEKRMIEVLTYEKKH